MSGAFDELLALAAIVLAAASGVPGLFLDRRGTAGERWAVALLALAATAGVAAATSGLTGGDGGISVPWSVPGGALHVEVDALSAVFLLPAFGLGLLGAIYGLESWRQADHPENGRKLRLFYGFTIAGMGLLLVARNGVLFLMGWEVMALAAFVTLATEDHEAAVREASYIYLAATRIGSLCLYAVFVLLLVASGSFELRPGLDAQAPAMAAVFVLALAGFGLKAGIMPLHVWLPGAHANAPSHVSALMSGVLIKMGIYGLLRVTMLFTTPPAWWGIVVLSLGVLSGVLGVAFALGQRDLKRLLAYHSVENVGIICVGVGLALLGRAAGRPELIVLGLGGGLLHVWNHGLFKALLFFGAGAVVHATGTRQMDALGGLGRRMPFTALAFLVGSLAICGLPPLNGFVSELFIYLGLFRATGALGTGGALAGALGAAGLALTAGLAAACSVQMFGTVFLGQERSPAASRAHEPGRAVLEPMGILAAGCLAIGLGSPLVAPALDRAIAAWAPGAVGKPLATLAPLVPVTLAGFGLLLLLALLGAWLHGRTRAAVARREVGTWDCGYAAPSPRMQYTSSSFAQILVDLFGWALHRQSRRPRLLGLFPGPTSFGSTLPDTILEEWLLPAGRRVSRGLTWFRWLQRGSVHAYLLYILAALVVLLIWR